jgi:hypothetical protein
MENKVCTKCNIEKPIELFTKDSKIKSGYTSRCKGCTTKYKKEHALLNAETIKINKKLYYES